MKERKRHFSFAVFLRLIRDALTELLKNDPLRLAGATAFFTTFALPPILVILIQGLSIIYTTGKVRQQLFAALSTYVGGETVSQLVNTLTAFHKLAHNGYFLVFGFAFLLFVATTLFKVIKSSINQVWKIKITHRSQVKTTVADRFKGVLVILVAGILFALGLFAEGLQAALERAVFVYSPALSVYLTTVFNYALSILLVTAWFAIVFRYLPDARSPWSVILRGALLTSILFIIGKAVLRWLLSYSNLNSLYGTSASIMLLMLFVFYSSLILYFGAAFTKTWSIHAKQLIAPRHYASHYQLITDEADDSGNEV